MYLNDQARQHMATGDTVISVDAKKKLRHQPKPCSSTAGVPGGHIRAPEKPDDEPPIAYICSNDKMFI
ncbi:hypothetical protein [Arthrobacter sp. N199823]|uniref:hypothetical protein n=1 Tax=Arthrobacter sp. N199823 TaxID=2058895 RepID=UPI000CE4CFD4|nr:hypothetical protein [Arthrobacter sp. N199823]